MRFSQPAKVISVIPRGLDLRAPPPAAPAETLDEWWDRIWKQRLDDNAKVRLLWMRSDGGTWWLA